MESNTLSPHIGMEGFVLGRQGLLHSEKQCPLNLTDKANENDLWHRVSDVLLGGKVQTMGAEYHIVITLVYLFFTLTLCRILRLLDRVYTPETLKPYTGDIITTFQCLSCGLENGMTKRAYGLGAYSVQTFFMGLYFSKIIPGTTCGNPVGNFLKYFEGRRKLLTTLLHMACNTLTGLVTLQYARFVWSMELSDVHAARRLREANCESHINVPILTGLAIELSATAINIIVCRTTTKRFRFDRYEQFVKSVFGIWMTICGLHLTGMYINPANATMQTYGCRGNTPAEYVIVYWLGPLLGGIVGVVMHRELRKAYLNLKASLQAPIVEEKKYKRIRSQSMVGG